MIIEVTKVSHNWNSWHAWMWHFIKNAAFVEVGHRMGDFFGGGGDGELAWLLWGNLFLPLRRCIKMFGFKFYKRI